MAFSLSSPLRLAGAALLALSLASCRVTTPSPSGFGNYVALGDSLTAGMQSGGLTARNQRDSFPVVLSRLAGAPIHAPETLGPGCPPPLGVKVSLTSCIRAQPFAPTSNFGVPGATVRHLLKRSYENAPDSRKPLYTLVLGPNDTQVSAALRTRPQFITLWIGANDVLGATLTGNPGKATPAETFERQYAQLLDALAPSGARIILITVPDVSGIPGLISGPRLATLGLADNSCKASANRVSVVTLNERKGTLLSCDAPYALTPEESQAARATVRAYNTSIRRLAEQRGHPVFDADELLREAKRAEYDPQLAEPFGPDFSRDGIHPSSSGYARIARGLAAFINERYGTRIDTE